VVSHVRLCGFTGVVVCELCMAVSEMGVVSGSLSITGLVMLRCFPMVLRCVLVVLRCFRVMLCRLL
jgi:hypothetical protein